jgi:hypothetical protein
MVVFTILPEIPDDLAARPAAAVDYMQRATAAAGLMPKAVCKVRADARAQRDLH